MKDKLVRLVSSEKQWVNLGMPEGLHEDIMGMIRAGKIIDRTGTVKPYWGFALAGALAASFIFFILIMPLFGGHSVSFVYPYNGETQVEIIGSFNDYHARIPLKLDSDSGTWRTDIKIRSKGVYEYQFIINGTVFTVGNARNVIKGKDGQDKALLSII